MDIKERQVHSRILPPLVLAAWAGMFGFLLIGGRYQLFLKPEFEFLIIGGLVISGLFLFGILGKGIPRGQDTGIKALFLLLPILFIFSAGENTLGSYALSKRTLVAPESGMTASRSDVPDSQEIPDTASELTSISRLIFDWDQYKGKPVVLEGLFSGKIDGAPDMAAVYRYFVTCCAADAMPVGVFLDKPRDLDIAENQWVRVAGQVTVKQVDGYEMIFMSLDRIEVREKPSKNAAYLYN